MLLNYDVYNRLLDDHGIEAANWYENNPDLPGSSNPHVNPLIPLPLELVKAPAPPVTDVPYDPFANEVKPNLGAKPGDQIAFFGGKPKPKPKPTRRTNKGTLDATYAPLGMGGMTPEKFFQKYGMTPNEYLKLPAN